MTDISTKICNCWVEIRKNKTKRTWIQNLHLLLFYREVILRAIQDTYVITIATKQYIFRSCECFIIREF